MALRRRGENEWSLDLTHLKLFKGLSVIARMIGDDLLEQCRAGISDIATQRRIIADITPELASLVSSIFIYARSDVLKDLPSYQEQFHLQLRTVFGTLQRPRWGNILFPELFESQHKPKALLFPFHLHYQEKEIDYYFLVERDVAGRFLRIVIEREEDSRLNLASISHRVVDDLDRRTYLQGLTRISESVYFGMLRECENYRNEYTDNARRHSHFFSQLRNAGLGDAESLTLRWPAERTEYLVRSTPEAITSFLKRVFIVLEDRDVVRQLLAGDVVEMKSGTHSAFIDLSRHNRCLNVSLDQKRESTDLDFYLNRMPLLKKVGETRRQSFAGYRIFLIHHITGEILATIKAMENMGAAFIHVLYVKYAGVVPPDYLETLLTLPEDRYQFGGLQKIDTADRIEGYYLLSRQYSSIEGLRALDEALNERKLNFFDAMQLAAGHLFFLEAFRARAAKQRILLVEDGGYLSPVLNRFCLEGRSLREALAFYAVPVTGDSGLARAELDGTLSDWLGRMLPGSVEHTRNGYNRLEDLERTHGRLQFPATTIAISNMKRIRESEEVSISILHAIESILHGIGLVFSERRVLVIGSRGAIGSNLMEDLSAKVGPKNVFGIDVALAARGARAPGPWVETAALDQLPDECLYDCDMVIGVVGQSTLKKKELEQLVLQCKRPYIFFASGSTKTAEFTDLSVWIRELQGQRKAKVGGVPVELEVQPIRDPQTAHIVGSRVRFFFQPDSKTDKKLQKLKNRTRDLYLLGGLTPINFLFYGVPTETMDPILAQLLRVAAGLVEMDGEGKKLPARLLAVDRDVDVDGRLLETKKK